MTPPIKDAPGVYIIRSRVNGATYTGSSLLVRKRLKAQVAMLRVGRSSARLLQLDWDRFGEDEFEILACHKPVNELYFWEEKVTLLTDSLDDVGGYNRMVGNRVWSLSSRIKNTEQKLIKKRKFSPLPGLTANPRLTSAYMRTFCQQSTPFFKHDPLLTAEMDLLAKRSKLQELLCEFSPFDLK